MRNDQRLRRKVRRSYIVSTVSISLVLFLLGSVGYMLYGALSTAHTLRESVTLSAELENTLDEKAREKIEQQLLAIDGVRGVSYSPREEKINDEEFRRMFASEIEHILEDNPLRNSFEVAVAIAEKEQTDAIADAIASIEGVVYVAYPASTIERLHSTISKITIVLLAFGGALLIISLILLNNTIRLAIFSRRYLINTLKLVGATKSYIMRPFLVKAAQQGVWAGAVAAVMFVASLAALSGALPELMTVSQIEMVAIMVAAMVAAGVIISLLFTSIAVNKFVNMKSNKIYLY